MKTNLLRSISIALITLLLVAMGNSAERKKGDGVKNVVRVVRQALQDGTHEVASVQQLPTPANKQAKAMLDQRRFEQQGKMLKKISDEHTIMGRIHQSLQQAERKHSARTAMEVQQSENVKIFGKPTRFTKAPNVAKQKSVSHLSKISASNVLINGKTQDTVDVGDPFTLTFSFASNSVSAVMNVYLDADSNGIVSAGDIPLETNALMLDNDDNDTDPAVGTYKITSGKGDVVNSIVSSLIFEINDYQSISSAVVTIRQKPTSSIIIGKVDPPVANLVCYTSGYPDGVIVFTDSAGMFSFYIDRQLTSEVTLYFYDLIGVANGYLIPQEKTIAITSDTTRVDIALTPTTSFIEGYVKDQTGATIRDATVEAYSSFDVRTKTDSTGYYKLGVQEGECYCYSDISWSTDYMQNTYSTSSVNVPANATVHHDIMFIKANNTISGKVNFNTNGVGGIPINVSADSLYNSVLSSIGGNYSVPVYKPTTGIMLYTVGASVVNGYIVANSVQTNIQPGATNVNFKIKKVTGGLQGTITDINTGKPVPQAYIYASGSTSRSVYSNDTGYYRMSLPDGVYSFSIEADPYFTYTESNVVISGAMVTMDFALRRSGSFSGTIKDNNGKPLPSAYIIALDNSGSSVGYGYSDMQGKYVVSGLGTSHYRAYSSKDGFITQWYNNVSVLDSATYFQVTEGYDTPNINFTLSHGGSISGQVVDRSGKPIADIEIEVFDTLFNYQSYATTNDSGNYVTGGLPTGKYYVRTWSSQYFDQWYNGASSQYTATKVNVVINQNTPDINFILNAGSTISGTVKNKDNVGIPYASVYLTDSVQNYIAYAYTNDSGYYSMPRLEPGKKVYAYSSEYGYIDRWYNNVSTFDSATAIILQPEEKREIDFVLHLAGFISGRVFDNAGNPISYAYVYSQDSSGSYYGYGSTDQQGNYTITNLTSGKYYVEASSDSYIDQWFDHKAMIEQADKVTVVEEKVTPNINFNLRRSGSITGDSVIVRIKLANIPDTLVFSQSYVPDYCFDYYWGIRFDVDGIDSTGPNGCEIEIALNHYKTPGDTPFKSNIINGTSHVMLEWIGNSGNWRHDVSAWIDPLNKNTLVMSVPKSWTEIAGIGVNTKYYVYTLYYSKSGFVGDETSIGHGMVSLTDPVGDVPFDFIDIVAAGNIITSVQTVTHTPTTFRLDQNYPNPFNPSTTIAFDLPHTSLVSLKVYNVLGQEVATLVDEIRPAGRYQERWNASNLASGIYFYRLQAGSFTETKKLVLLR